MPDLSQPWGTFPLPAGKASSPRAGSALLISAANSALCSARLVWLQRGDKDRQCLCHQSGTVACICVLFGLQTLPDLSVQQCPAPASLGVARGQAGTCRLSGTSLPHGTWPSPSVAPGTRAPLGPEPLASTATPQACGAQCAVGLCHPASAAALRASRPPVSSPSQIPPLE